MKYLLICTLYLLIAQFPVNAAGTSIYSIPACPEGLSVAIYAFNPEHQKIHISLPTVVGRDDLYDAKTFLIQLGIDFPEGGFAFYNKNNNFLIIATDSINQDKSLILLE